MSKYILKKVVVDDTSKTKKRNERYVINTSRRNKESKTEFVIELEAFEISKRGAYQLSVAIGEEGIRSLFDEKIESKFLINRFNLDAIASLCDLMDALPCYAAIHLDIEMESDWYHAILVKENTETQHQLASFRIPELRMSFND